MKSNLLRRVAFLVWYRAVRYRFERVDRYALKAFDLDLRIAPGVLHPRCFASSRLLVRLVSTLQVDNKRLADLGTGSGIASLVAARRGAQVVALDVDETALACARKNVDRNGLTAHIEVRASDVLGGLEPHEQFDIIVTNPPFFSEAPAPPLHRAFSAGPGHEFFIRLAAQLGNALKPGGVLYFIMSSDVDHRPIQQLFVERGFGVSHLQSARSLFETLSIYTVRARR